MSNPGFANNPLGADTTDAAGDYIALGGVVFWARAVGNLGQLRNGNRASSAAGFTKEGSSALPGLAGQIS
jgi:hypothetical protein